MKIVIATPLFPPEIAEPAPYVKQLAERLCGTQDITVVAYTNFAESVPGMKLIAVNKRQSLPIRLFAFTSALFTASKHASIIFAENGVAAGVSAVIVGALRRIPVVIQVREDEAWERAIQLGLTKLPREIFLQRPPANLRLRLIRRLQSFVLHRAKKVVAPPPPNRALLVRVYGLRADRVVVGLYPPEKLQVLPFPIEPVPYQVLTMGSDISWKEVASVVRAIAMLVQKLPEIKLVVVGDGPEQGHLRMLADELHMTQHVSFVGRVSHAESWYLRKSSAAIVVTATDAQLPDTIVQGFAADVPVVAVQGAAVADILLDGESGLIVPPGDDDALAQSIERVLRDETIRTTLLTGSKKVLADISWDAHLAKLLQILVSATH